MVVGGCWWLQVVLDGFRSFHVLVLTTQEDANHAFIATALLLEIVRVTVLMILTLFSFIYENKTEEFTKPRVDHTFDNLRCNKRCLQNENVLPVSNYKTKTLAKNTSLDVKTLKLVGSSFCSFTYLNHYDVFFNESECKKKFAPSTSSFTGIVNYPCKKYSGVS